MNKYIEIMNKYASRGCSAYEWDLHESNRLVVLETMKIYDRAEDIEEVYMQSEEWTDKENEDALPTILVVSGDHDDVEDLVLHELLDNEYGFSIYRDISKLKIDYKTVPFLEHLYAKYQDSIFPTPQCVLNQLICVAGNGISHTDFELVDDTRPYNKKYCVGNMINELTPKPVILIYPYNKRFYFNSDEEMYNDRQYNKIKDIDKYVEYFIDCIDMTNEETLRDRLNEEHIHKHFFRWSTKTSLESDMNKIVGDSMKDIKDWKDNINELRDYYECN